MDWVEVSYQEGLQNHLAVHKIFREFGALVWDEIDQQGDEPLFWSILVLLILAMLQHQEFHSFYKLLLIEPLQLRPEFYFITRPLNQIRAHVCTISRIPCAFWWGLSKFDRRGSGGSTISECIYLEKWLSLKQFRQNTSRTPHINSRCISFITNKKLGGTIP